MHLWGSYLKNLGEFVDHKPCECGCLKELILFNDEYKQSVMNYYGLIIKWIDYSMAIKETAAYEKTLNCIRESLSGTIKDMKGE